MPGTKIGDGVVSNGGVSWSSDGAFVVCSCGSALTVVRADGSGGVQVLDQGALGPPAWSPDGHFIAYDRNCEEMDQPPHDVYCDVAVTTPDGSSPKTLLRHGRWKGPADLAPVWFTSFQLIVQEWGFGPDAHLESVDPASGARGVIRREPGWLLVAGSAGAFAYERPIREGSHRLEVVIADHAGRVLERHRLPAAADQAEGALYLR